MLHSHPLAAGLGLLTLVLGACTTAPPGPLPQDHPASVHAPVAPVRPSPSALTGYRDFSAAPPNTPGADIPATDHSTHQRQEAGGSASMQDDQEDTHERDR